MDVVGFSPVDLAGELPAGVCPGELDGHPALGRAGPVLVRDLPLLRVRQLDGAVPPRYLQKLSTILARGLVNFLPQNRLDPLPQGLTTRPSCLITTILCLPSSIYIEVCLNRTFIIMFALGVSIDNKCQPADLATF